MYDLQTNGGQTIGFVRNGGEVWQFAQSPSQPTPQEVPVSVDYTSTVAHEMAAHWFLTLRPLADPAAIFTPTAEIPQLDKKLLGVKVWLSAFPPAAVYFDPETHRLTRVVYEDHEGGVRSLKRFDLSGEATTDGVTYPAAVVESANGRVRGDWPTMNVEFPDKVDPKLFEKP